MKNEVRFGWLGETRRVTLHVLLAELVKEWGREWWVGVNEGDVEVRAIDDSPVRHMGSTSLLSKSEAGLLAFHLGSKEFDSIGRFLVATASDADTELAKRVGEDALKDLAARIQRRAGYGKSHQLVRDEAPLDVEQSRLGAFRVSVSLGRLQWELAIDRRMADRLAPPSIGKATDLVGRQKAIEHAPLQVTATMDFGSVALAQLSDLSVGEVLVGDRKLDDVLHIHLQGHGAVATGYLRRSGQQRAVLVDGIQQREKHTHE